MKDLENVKNLELLGKDFHTVTEQKYPKYLNEKDASIFQYA